MVDDVPDLDSQESFVLPGGQKSIPTQRKKSGCGKHKGWGFLRNQMTTMARVSCDPAGFEVENLTKEAYWPPPREQLRRTTVRTLSLHQLPKVSACKSYPACHCIRISRILIPVCTQHGEHRPNYSGSRSECHKYAQELSGSFAPPNKREASSPQVRWTIHAIGGFTAVSKALPLQQGDDAQMIALTAAKGNGLNVNINEVLHFVAAEPHATFVRVSVIEGKQELAYESAVLGRLRGGYRIFQLRSCFGTRIELCYLFAKISFGTEINKWATTRQ
eukprot:5385042-Prymnesium_polylepis.2